MTIRDHRTTAAADDWRRAQLQAAAEAAHDRADPRRRRWLTRTHAQLVRRTRRVEPGDRAAAGG